jgi:DNA-binding transcriptional ArsR family regulator
VINLKSIKTIKDPKAFELLADETRRKVIYLLRVKEMTVSQIASELGLTAQAIYHHIRKMKAAGMVEVAREERVGHFIETYYRSAAEIFMLAHGEAARKQTYEEQARATLEGLSKLGLISMPDQTVVGKVAKLVKEIETCCKSHEWSDKIGEMGDVPFFVKQAMTEYAHLLSEDDEHYSQSIRLQGELRGVLRSCAPAAKAKPKKK